MSTIRKQKKVRNFTTLANEMPFDRNLSPGAKGIMTFLLALPNDWVISIAHLCNSHPKVGRVKITTILTELREEGYILRVDYRDRGRYGTEYTVFETKVDRAEWMKLNNVQDGQVFDHKPHFVIPDLSDPQDPGEPKQRKSRKTEEELRLAAEIKEAERKAKAEETERRKAIKAERERLAEEKREQDKAWRYELFGGKDRYNAFTSWFFAHYAPNSGLDKPDMFYVITLRDLAAGGEKYRHILMRFEQFEKQEAKKLEAERQNTIATERAKTLEQQNQPVQEQPEVTQEPSVVNQVSPKEFLRPDDLEWFESSNLKDDLLAGCIAELNHMKDHWVMHRSIISKYRKPQQARDLGLVAKVN